MTNAEESVLAELRGRVLAYNRVFDRQSPYTIQVLTDLARFCRAHESTFHADARAHAVAEGRREVWLRIQEYLQMSGEELIRLHQIKQTRIRLHQIKQTRKQR